MAGDWIKFEHATPDKEEVHVIAQHLGVDPDAVVGKLLRLWIWADQQSVDGNALRVTDSFLDRITFCAGFAVALRKAGWLTGREGHLSIPNFARHNGQTAKQRGLSAKRTKESRKRNATTVTDPLPEKRREEKSSFEESKDSSSSQGSPANPSSGLVFATQTGPWHLPSRKLAEYVSSYAFDVKQELLKAAQWLRDNKGRRPRSPEGMKRFLTRWLNRVSDGAGKSRLVGKIANDDGLKAELERARKVREKQRHAG